MCKKRRQNINLFEFKENDVQFPYDIYWHEQGENPMKEPGDYLVEVVAGEGGIWKDWTVTEYIYWDGMSSFVIDKSLDNVTFPISDILF